MPLSHRIVKSEKQITKELKKRGWSGWDIKSYLTGWRKPSRKKTKVKQKDSDK